MFSNYRDSDPNIIFISNQPDMIDQFELDMTENTQSYYIIDINDDLIDNDFSAATQLLKRNLHFIPSLIDYYLLKHIKREKKSKSSLPIARYMKLISRRLS